MSRVGFSGLWFMWTGFGGRGVGVSGLFGVRAQYNNNILILAIKMVPYTPTNYVHLK